MLTINKYIFPLITFMVGFALCGCSDDNAPEPAPFGGDDAIVLRLTAQAPTVLGTRFVSDGVPDVLTDTMATKGEWMKSWVIVVENPTTTGKALAVYHHAYADNDFHEQDTVAAQLEYNTSYKVYTFANLTKDQLKHVGLMTDAGVWLKAGDDIPDFSQKTIMVKGNHKDSPASDEITGNGDIPMSNVQTITTPVKQATNNGTAQFVDLFVVRTVGKIRVEVSNPELVDLQVGQIDILDSLTSNAYSVITVDPDDNTKSSTTSKDNLKLLPGAPEKYSYETAIDGNPTYRRVPNLNGTPLAFEGVTYTTDDNDNTVPKATVKAKVDDKGVPQTDKDGHQLYDTIPGRKVFTFLVNESDLESVSSTSEGYKLRLTNGHEDSESQSVQRDYSFTDFTRIARNEIHVLPITLRRFDPRFTIEAFTAIGVVPTATDRPDYALIDLGMYGEFHLVPTVLDWLDGSKEVDLSKATSISFNRSEKANDNSGDLATGDHLKVVWNSNAAKPTYEVKAGNYSGYVTYVFTATFNPDSNSTSEVKSITRRVRLINHAIDFTDPDWAKRWRGGVKQ